MSAVQMDLFGGEFKEPARKSKLEDYDGFMDKFAKKTTTDDCYTPQAIYEAVLDWCRKRYGIGPETRIMRPFRPGGDFEREDYGGDCIVIDNPPFSILSLICEWYVKHGVRFFLFAPYLRSVSCSRWATVVVVGTELVYENGAKVPTSFVTNMEGDTLIMNAIDLRERLVAADLKNTRSLPRFSYPRYVLTEAMVGYMASHSTPFCVSRKDCSEKISSLASQRAAGKNIYGGGFLLSERAAAEKAAAEKAAAEKVDRIEWTLNDDEMAIVRGLG